MIWTPGQVSTMLQNAAFGAHLSDPGRPSGQERASPDRSPISGTPVPRTAEDNEGPTSAVRNAREEGRHQRRNLRDDR